MYRTVQGLIDNQQIGITYIHEHLYVVPNDLAKYEDYTLDDVYHSIAELYPFKNSGGKTILDMTPVGYGRNPLALKFISEATDVNVMFITGFHKQEFQPKWIDNLSNTDIYEFLIHEINEGVTSQKLLPAAMKIGTSNNQVTDSEYRLIQIAGNVQKDTGIPIVTHCDNGTMGMEQLSILKENGADLTKVCLSHVDLTKNIDYLKQICETGASISFDHIGRELETNDKDRVQMIKELVNSGFENHICLSGDMGRKKYLHSYNGSPGLDYILNDLKHELLKVISEESYFKMITKNPQTILEWEK